MKSLKTRRLVAIMFTDIVGYTALMQKDENRAIEARDLHRHVFDLQHETYEGEILQYFGDGTMSVFQSGVKAVECAISIQKSLSQGEPVPIRIGLHMGDIVFDGTEIYGDGVNLASRIESMGVAGGVLLSAKLNDELKNHPEISTISLGHFDLKNIEKPIEVFSVSNEGISIPRVSELKIRPKVQSKSIAVLPFINMSASKENEYFSDGMTEEIINALSKIKKLKVTSRTSSFFFKGKNIPIPQIGKELNVSTILEGSIRLSGNMMRITAQLINASDDFHFWSETFDRATENIFAVQDEISLLIADKLREHIGHLEIEDQLVADPEIPIETYKKYLKGRYYVLKLNLSDIQKGFSILEEVIEEEPDFPLAYLSVHHGYAFLGALGLLPTQESFAKGKVYLDKAIELDKNLPECQFQLAGISYWQNWDIPATLKHLNKAIELRPAYADAYQVLAATISMEGKFEDALSYIDKAIELDPLSPMNFYVRGLIFYLQEDFIQAISYFKKSVSLEAHFIIAKFIWGASLILAGQKKEALAFFLDFPEDRFSQMWKLGGTSLAYAALGNLEEAELGIKSMQAALDTDSKGRVLHFLILCKTILGRYEEALDLIKQAKDQQLPIMLFLKIEPLLKPLHEHPRFKELTNQVWKGETSHIPQKKKYQSSSLKQKDLEKYYLLLAQYMSEHKPYLQADLSLRGLAQKVNIHPNHLSQLLNEKMGKNFSEYINSFRLETFKTKAKDPANQHLTILGLAFDSGFNSKTVFNTYFKKETAMTPKAWMKSLS